MKKKKINIGGVALFDGIMFTSDYRQVTVQKNNDRIKCNVTNFRKDKRIINKIPIIRGILGISSQIGNSSEEFIESSGEKVGKNSTFKTILSYIFLIVICISLPIIISIPFGENIRQLIQILVVLLEFTFYISLVKLISEFNVLFMYHGAEHKAVNAYENLNIEDINIENIKKQSRFHKRCGGNFIAYFILLTILSVFVPINNLLLKSLVMIGLSILNIGIAFEIVTLFSKFRKPFDILNYPATLIQLVTTKEPTDEMLKIAMYGVLGSGRENNGITPQEFVKRYVEQNLKGKEYDTQDIYSILEYVTNIDRNRLILQKDNYLISLSQEIEADRLLNKYYDEKYPLQYLTHKQYFYNEIYYVDENVLIPRADSEILVEKAIEYINNEDMKNVIDLCTGSGALGISISKNTNIEKMTLIDISLGAIKVAKRNIQKNGVSDKVTVQISDLLNEKISEIKDDSEKRVDMIVSNPPYIKTSVINTLQEEVQKEPHLALDGGKNGLDFYLRIIKEAKEVLRPNGILIFEIGYDQLSDLKDIIKENEEYNLLESVKDYGGNDRVVVCRFQGK